MSNIYIDPHVASQDLRGMLYRGDLVVLTKLDPVAEFAEFVRGQLRELFAPHDPEQAHACYTPAELALVLGAWKPSFIHHQRSKELTRAIAVAAGFDPQDTYYDVPKPRTSYPEDHLTTGIAFAFPWHRDTWYAGPAQQINWWFPVFNLKPENAMKFDPHAFARAVDNDSDTFDSYQANRDRFTVAKQVGKDSRSRPGAKNHTAPEELVVLPIPGQVILFSGAQLHASIRNISGMSRYSVDFRTISRQDVEAGIGAPLVDVRCTGTMLREFACVSTEERLPEEFVRKIAGAPPDDAILLFDETMAKKSAKMA
jgi:hypothetical protein